MQVATGALRRARAGREGDRITATPLHGTTPLVATVRVVNRTLEPPLQFAVVEADLDDAQLADHDALLGTMVDVRFEQ